jgi:hypothetical protein
LVLVVVVALTAVQLSATPAGAAVRPFGPTQTVVGGCNAESADSVTGSTGAVTGFAACRTSSGLLIRFFSRNPDGSVNPSETTGFTGQVLGVAADATATYVLFFTGTQIRIGKRTTAGAFSSRALYNWSGVSSPTGDVIAQGGQWFGVWSVQVGPTEFAPMELFSAGSVLPVGRVTTTGGSHDDHSPTLAYAGTVPVLIWSRTTSPEVPGPSDLMVTKYFGGRWQAERVFASLGTDNLAPDMAMGGGRTFVTWTRDGATMVASNPSGSFASHRFLTPGFGPKVAASTTSGAVDHVFVSWTSTATGSDRVFFAETASTGSVQGTWDGTYITPTGTTTFGVGGFATKATVVYGTAAPSPSVALRAQT